MDAEGIEMKTLKTMKHPDDSDRAGEFERLRAQWQADPLSVDSATAARFQSLEFGIVPKSAAVASPRFPDQTRRFKHTETAASSAIPVHAVRTAPSCRSNVLR